MWLWWSACTLHSEFIGPGFEEGTYISKYAGPFLVAVTHARSASGQSAAFGDHVEAIEQQIATSDGLIGYSLRGDIPGRDNWTLSIWESEEDMVEFMTTGAHLAAMGDAGTVLEEGHFEWWEEADPAAMPPVWSEALDRLP